MLFVMLLIGGCTSESQPLTSFWDSGAVHTDVQAAAEPFPVQQVRITEGPFRDAMERDIAYLLDLEPDRFLHNFRELAGLEPKAPHYGGWESMQIAGHSLGHYLTALSFAYAQTGQQRIRDRIDYIVEELALAQAEWGNGYVGAIPGQRELWEEIRRGDVNGEPFGLNGVWVPWYTLHKLYAGLIDAHSYAESEGALRVVTDLADWAIETTGGLSHDQWQEMLDAEHGGMNEALANLYAITGEERFMQLSRKFHHEDVLHDRILRTLDLEGLHANTQIPKVIGAVRQYELTGDDSLRTIADAFWDQIVQEHTYAMGGNTEGEHLGPPGALDGRLGTTTAETCNTYNMLKLTRHLFALSAAPRYADYYEGALYNHILASQEPARGMMTYFVSLRPGHFKTYSTPDSSFWCCTGSGMENHVRYGQGIYFHRDDALYVNLFIPSEVEWAEQGITLRQETGFPRENTTRLTLSTEAPTDVELRIRHPKWAVDAPVVRVSGQFVDMESEPGSYITLRRTWESGDTIEVEYPMTLHTEPLPGAPDQVAVLYGPIVLAGVLGTDGMPADSAYAKDHLAYTGADLFIPADLRDRQEPYDLDTPSIPRLDVDPERVDEWVQPVDGEPLTFRVAGAGLQNDIMLRPFYDVHHQRYTVYWPLANVQANNVSP